MPTLTREAYIEALKKHGRRVANRLALASLPVAGRSLDDFYACYGPETALPEGETAKTDMVYLFDPAGWFVYYEAPDYTQWPEPPKNEPQK